MKPDISSSLEKHKNDWEELANLDPLWAILSDPEKKFCNWDLDSFLSAGQKEIGELMKNAERLKCPALRETALDFGCGVGRLTRALADFFPMVYGLDISENMIFQAQKLNVSLPNCKFLVNTKDNLSIFPNAHFDLIYSNIVLQHIPKKNTILSYISEFIRVLKTNGLAVFQLPSYIPLKRRIQPRRRVYSLLRNLGVSERFLYEKLRLNPIRMNFIEENKIVSTVMDSGGRILEIKKNPIIGRDIESNTYFISK